MRAVTACNAKYKRKIDDGLLYFVGTSEERTWGARSPILLLFSVASCSWPATGATRHGQGGSTSSAAAKKDRTVCLVFSHTFTLSSPLLTPTPRCLDAQSGLFVELF